MGHVKGGYKSILAAAQQKLKDCGVKVLTNTAVKGIEPLKSHTFNEISKADKGDFKNHVGKASDTANHKSGQACSYTDSIRISISNFDYNFDNLLLTVNNSEVMRLLNNSNNDFFLNKL